MGVIEVSNNSIETFEKIKTLKEATDLKLLTLKGKVSDARKVVDRLYQNPIIDVMGITEIISKSQASSYNLINELNKLGILKEMTSGRRKRQYWFSEYLRLFL